LSVLIAKKNASGKGGWVDASPYDKIAGPFFDRYLEFFSSLEKFNQRTKREEAEKTLVGRVLWTILVPRLDSDPSVEAIFFESGSSTAYAAYEFLEYARKNSGYWQKSGMAENLRIVTNNFFTLLDFTLYGHGSRPVKEITLYPQGPFSEDYAATYGDIRDVRPDNRRAFHRKGWSLDSGAAEACAKVTKDIDSLLGKKGLIVMAVSGVDWSDDHICGPHVGRYRNMLMKRSLLQSTHPKVIVLDNAKWFKSFDYDECYPVCGSGIDWSTLLKDSPIAFAVGVNNADRDGKAYDIILEDLKRRGFDSVETEIAADGKVSAIIAWNSAFESWLEG
jgi:hypothetical protein